MCYVLGYFLIAIFIVGCSRAGTADCSSFELAQVGSSSTSYCSEATWTESDWDVVQSLSLAALAAAPPPSVSDEKVRALGRDLFFDARLSKTGTVSCATCHRPEFYLSDGRARSSGLKRLQRNAPTLLGAGHLSFYGWDGRKDSLWAQALAPFEAVGEHGLTRIDVVRLVLTHYGDRFREIYPATELTASDVSLRIPARPVSEDSTPAQHEAWSKLSAAQQVEITRTFARIGNALAQFIRRLPFTEAPFDAYVKAVRAGDPTGGGHLSESAVRGLRAFIGAGRCVTCHNGPLLSDGQFHNLGLPPVVGVSDSDSGRREGARLVKKDEFRCDVAPITYDGDCGELRYLDPEFPAFVGAFKTPTLRNVEKTAPYMHAGHFDTLQGVVEFYRTLSGTARTGSRDPLLTRLPRDVRTSDMVEFLRSLTGPLPPVDGVASHGL